MPPRLPIPPTVRFDVLRRDGHRCVYCNQGRDDGAKLEIDHKVPVSDGGTNDFDNLVTACFACNRGKGAHPLDLKAKIKELEDEVDKWKLLMKHERDELGQREEDDLIRAARTIVGASAPTRIVFVWCDRFVDSGDEAWDLLEKAREACARLLDLIDPGPPRPSGDAGGEL